MKSRVLTAFGLIPFVLGAFFCASPWPLLALAVLAGAACCFELSKLIGGEILRYAGMAIVFLACASPFGKPLSDPRLALTLFVLFLIGVLATAKCAKSKDSLFLFPLLSSCWFLAPLVSLVVLHAIGSGHDAYWVWKTPILLAVLPLWGGDTAAIFAGKAFGKHPLAPTISPKKTVEGAVANLLACIVVAVPLATWIGYPSWVGAACGLIAGVFGQLGDLFESYVKRQVGAKDSGTLLPGHGGVLDRIDSILFTAPFVALLITGIHAVASGSF